MLWYCEGCHTLYAPGLTACPQCGGHDYRLAPGGDPLGNVLSSAPAPAAEAPQAGKKQRANTPAAASTEPTASSADAAPAGK